MSPVFSFRPRPSTAADAAVPGAGPGLDPQKIRQQGRPEGLVPGAIRFQLTAAAALVFRWSSVSTEPSLAVITVLPVLLLHSPTDQTVHGDAGFLPGLKQDFHITFIQQ